MLLLLAMLIAGLSWLSAQPAADPLAPAIVDTPRPLERSIELIAGGMNAEATARAANQSAAGYYAAQTAEAQELTRVADQAALYRTETAAAATRAAGDASTQQAWQVLSWTATADVDRATASARTTEQAWQYTQAAIVSDLHQTETASSINLRQTETAAAYIGRTLQRDEQRQELTNTVLAVAPWLAGGLLLIAVIAIIIVAVVRLAKSPQVIQRDKRGDIGILVSTNGDYYDPDRSPVALVRLVKSGAVVKALADPGAQERTVARDQTVDLYNRGLPGQQTAPRPQRSDSSAQPPPAQIAGPNFRIFGPAETPDPLLRDPEVIKILDVDWKEDAV